MNNWFYIPLLLVALVSAGCATAPQAEIATARTPANSSASAEARIGRAEVGEVVSLPGGNALGVESVRVIREYPAASGRICRRVVLAARNGAERVLCRRSSGEWYLSRALSTADVLGGTRMASAIPSLGPDGSVTLVPAVSLEQADQATDLTPVDDEAMSVLLDSLNESSDPSPGASQGTESAALTTDAAVTAADEDMSVVALNANETLWAFSRRVTGNALNWQSIADANAINDATRLTAGTELRVPTALLRAGR